MHPIIDVPMGVAIDQDLQWLIMRMQSVCLSKVSTECTGDCSHSFPVAQMVEHGTSNAKIMGSIPRESKSWSNVKL